MQNRPEIAHEIDHDDDPERRRRRSIATTFSRSDDYELLLALKAVADVNPIAHARLEGLHPSTRIAFGSYTLARELALAEGLIDESGEPK